jgi:hypothetical protein
VKVSTLETIFRALGEAGVRYLVAGGVAVVAHGYLRLTKDVDLFVDLDPANVIRALEVLEALDYRPHQPVTAAQFADPQQRRRLIREKGMKVLTLYSNRYPDTPVDLFVDEPLSFEEEYERALVKELAPGLRVPFVSRAALIRLKREAGRPQDMADIDQLELLADDP